jgi:hypothetical protein
LEARNCELSEAARSKKVFQNKTSWWSDMRFAAWLPDDHETRNLSWRAIDIKDEQDAQDEQGADDYNVPKANGALEAAETQQLEVSCDDLAQHTIDAMPGRVHCPRRA